MKEHETTLRGATYAFLSSTVLVFAAAALALLVAPSAAAIENGPCSWCTENSGCSTPCIDENENQSTCGDEGVCDQCREALVEIHRVKIGQDTRESYLPVQIGPAYRCQYRRHYLVTYQSLNSTSCQTYTYCETETETVKLYDNPSCCSLMPGGCWGQSC